MSRHRSSSTNLAAKSRSLRRILQTHRAATFRGDEEVSLLRVPACEMPEIKIDDVRTQEVPIVDSLAILRQVLGAWPTVRG